MNVASLELCKELYKLSEWSGTHFLYTKTGRLSTIASMFSYKPLPAYDLGYLLRKLPEELDRKIFVLTNGERPHAGYAERDNEGNYSLDNTFYGTASYAGTLEDAACKLAIELFKQGILKREDSHDESK